ncbi:ppGpp synthetase/RelA/SpoT-type nucleotidyltransferase [Sphingomonas faeni]|uniref:PpGpp synthetase/RelA/SpoT-type nucleotidyltransferase n=1 Tax=Sphingomonas faeni TaxID=185950 RepID=A0A2T5TZM5_9SPHN|nr:RelA/SpoT domain-containing protein [Sphingomonas faeni]PTW44672.1 ppGpp synthetase/RelA/SpoT-type nucleotidyltransferase [Sphingomonas faeni]
MARDTSTPVRPRKRLAKAEGKLEKEPGAGTGKKDFHAEYQRLLPLATRIIDGIANQMPALLAKHGVSLGVPIEKRVKDWSSLSQKIEGREPKKISDIQDIAGMRFILLFLRDLPALDVLINDNFDVVSSENTIDRLGSTQFGYQSTHYIVKLKDTWLGVPSYSDLGEIYVEIQVRTLSQHIWAASSHKLQYKKEESVPLPLRRTINRISALLETVDLELSRVLEERDAYIDSAGVTINDDDPLNVDLLQSLLDELLPPENKSDDEDYSELLEDLLTFDVNTVIKLRDLIISNKEHVEKAEARELSQRVEGGHVLGTSRARIDRNVFFNHMGLTREALVGQFGQSEVAKIINPHDLTYDFEDEVEDAHEDRAE